MNKKDGGILTLIIHNDRTYSDPMITRLRREPSLFVKIFTDVTSAMHYMKRKGVKVDILILDGRLSCGKDFPKEGTQNEMITGMVLYDQIRRQNREFRIILFTTMFEVCNNFAWSDPNLTMLMAQASTLEYQVIKSLERIFPGDFEKKVIVSRKSKKVSTT